MKYVKPYVAEYGKAQDVVQGECGWGIENWTLDKTGAVKRTVYVHYFKIDEYCLNCICYTTYTRGCEWQTRCNGETDC